MPDIIVYPNRPNPTGIPSIDFVGADGSGISLQVLQDGTISYYGRAGQLFTIVDSLTGLLTSVNNIAGLPIFEVYDSDKVIIGAFNTNAFVVSGSGAALGTDFIYPDKRLFISGDIRYEGHIWSGEQNLANIYYPCTNPSGYVTGFDLYQSGVILNAKIDSLSGFVLLASGGLDTKIQITGQQAWTHGQNNATNISGRLTATGQTILSILSGASGTLQTQINALPSTAYINGMGSILSGNLAQTGITLLNTIIDTGNNAVAHANGIGTNLTGLVNEAFLTLDNRIVDLSGYSNSTFATIDTVNLISGKINSLSGWAAPANANYVYISGIQTIDGPKTFAGGFAISGRNNGTITSLAIYPPTGGSTANNTAIELYWSPTGGVANSRKWNISVTPPVGSSIPSRFRIHPPDLTDTFTITSGGFVGIGTSFPEERLHVNNGNIKLTNCNILSGNQSLWDGFNTASISTSIINSGAGFNRLNLDCSGTNYQTSTLTGNTIISGINYAPGLSVTARIFADGTGRQLSFPSGWRFLGSAAPTSLATGKVAILTLTSFTNVDSGVVAAYAVEV